MIHNHEVTGSIPVPATLRIKELRQRNSFFISIGELLVNFRVSRKTQLQPSPSHAHNFIGICYLCIMKTEQLLRCIFPEILADYFDVIDIQESISQIDFWLDERNFMEEVDRKSGTVSSYGFTAERVVHDFPLRGKPVYLHVRRRKWRDSSTGEIFSYSYDDLTTEGSKLSPEFVSFLKE